MKKNSKQDILRLVEEEDVEFIRLQFTDMLGNLKNIAITSSQLERALDKLSRLEGDIDPIRGMKNRYRFKIDHYRILFTWEKGDIIITVVEINTRTNIKY